ncbi:MAG: hypothetical protein Q4A52_02275, partial [Bacillota bacterium]|nr:hypothetical protein [Bacillota bacterium]
IPHRMAPIGLHSFGLRGDWREWLELRYLVQTQWDGILSWEVIRLYPLYLLTLIAWVRHLDPVALFMIALFPVLVFEFRRIQVRRRIDRGIIVFLDVLNARMAVSSNLFGALELATESIRSVEIRRILQRFNLRVRLLGNRREAFASVQREVHHPYLRYIFMNLEHIAESWGDGLELLREIENDYISIQTEWNRSRTELENDRWMTYFGMLLLLYTASQILYKNPVVTDYFTRHPVVLGMFGMVAASGVWVLARAGRNT